MSAGTAGFASRTRVPQGPYGSAANTGALVPKQFSDRRDRYFCLATYLPQSPGGSIVLVLEQADQGRDGRFRFGTDLSQGDGGDSANFAAFIGEGYCKDRDGRPRRGTNFRKPGSGGNSSRHFLVLEQPNESRDDRPLVGTYPPQGVGGSPPHRLRPLATR